MKTMPRFIAFALALILWVIVPCSALPFDPLTDSIGQALAEHSNKNFQIPENKEVKSQLARITGPDRKGMEAMLVRAETWHRLIENAIEQKRLPPGLIALVMQESAFAPAAVSRTGAGGLWQFKPATARLFKLRHDAFVDERFDPVASTEKALEYLSALHEQFGNWDLAMAAYNWGKGALAKCIRTNGSEKNFWKLAAAGKIRPETRDYVPAIYARLAVWQNPEKFGFDPVLSTPPATFAASPLSDLSKMEKYCGLPVGTLTGLNPHLRAGCTPPYKMQHGIFVPKSIVAKLKNAVRLKKEKVFTTAIDQISSIRKVGHIVIKGDSLWGIGQKYNTCIRSLLDFNGWKTAPALQPGAVVTVYVLKKKSN